VTTYVAKFLSSVEAEALSRSEGEAISLMAQQRDCFASFPSPGSEPALRNEGTGSRNRSAPLKRHHALLPETAGVMALHRNDSKNDPSFLRAGF
jgi:hypothetical protein